MPRTVRFNSGDVFAVPLGPKWGYGYCRYLDRLVSEFFALQSHDLLPPDRVVEAESIFTVWVSKQAFASGAWPKIGRSEVVARPSPVFFKQDPISKRLSLYYQDGREKPATLAECQGLENAAVWSAHHIEDRLRGHFSGHPNKWVELVRPKEIVQ